MSSNNPNFRFVLRAAGWMLAAPLLCGCFLPAAPLQPLPQAAIAHDPPEKGLIRGEKPVSPAKTDAVLASDTKPSSPRGLMLHGGWYRAPLTAEESAAGIYERGAGGAPGVPACGSRVGEQGATSGETAAKVARYRYRHAGLEQLLAGPVSQRAELRNLLADNDHNVAATAAIGLTRQGDSNAVSGLVAAIEDEDLPLVARCAAVEALGQVAGDNVTTGLRALIDRFGQFTPGASTGYQADLHAELLRALSRHVDAGDDPRFIAAAQVPSAAVRIETLRAWASGNSGPLPAEIADLRSDDDPRVRASALAALATRRPSAARDYLTSAVHDVDLTVRLAAIRGLGQIDDVQAQATLADLLKDRAELIRAAAVAAIAVRGSQAVVLGAAGDASWRVRLNVAEALAGYGDSEGAVVARRLLDDRSAEVERQVVRSLAAWPWEVAGPVLLDALGKDAVTVRRVAAEQLAARWPIGGRFPYESPPPRRAEALGKLKEQFQTEFGTKLPSPAGRGAGGEGNSLPSPFGRGAGGEGLPTTDAEVEKLVVAGDIKALVEIGPTVVAALERLAVDRKLTLPEPVYRDVLSRHSAVFAALDRLRGENVDQRRRAAEELVLSTAKQPLGRLAVARLCALLTSETDTAVWLSALETVRGSDSEPAARMARSALGQATAEVRRQACEHLAAHPDPTHEAFLLPLLGDSEQAVVVAVIRALGAAGQVHDIGALKRQLASPREEIQLETAVALVRLHDDSGAAALERLSYSSDMMTRTRLAQALGALGDVHLAGILVRLLDDPWATVRHAALASLPKVAGRDLGQSVDGSTLPATDVIAGWKKWYADRPR